MEDQTDQTIQSIWKNKNFWRWSFVIAVGLTLIMIFFLNLYMIKYSHIIDPDKDPLQNALKIRFSGDVACVCTNSSLTEGSWEVTKEIFRPMEVHGSGR